MSKVAVLLGSVKDEAKVQPAIEVLEVVAPS